MSRGHRSGIALILVIMLIGLMGITLAYLGQGSRLMLVQTDLEYRKAIDRNLVLSGLAWAGAEAGGRGMGQKGEWVALDANSLAGSSARLSVMVEDVNDGTATVRVQTYVPSARHPLSRSRMFKVPRP
jgi:hypothetical protein